MKQPRGCGAGGPRRKRRVPRGDGARRRRAARRAPAAGRLPPDGRGRGRARAGALLDRARPPPTTRPWASSRCRSRCSTARTPNAASLRPRLPGPASSTSPAGTRAISPTRSPARAVWRAILGAWRAGAALAGCSAGACALSRVALDFAQPHRYSGEGLAVVPQLVVLPHFDRFENWVPGLAARMLARTPPDAVLVGIDEETALVGGDGRLRRPRQEVGLADRPRRVPFAVQSRRATGASCYRGADAARAHVPGSRRPPGTWPQHAAAPQYARRRGYRRRTHPSSGKLSPSSCDPQAPPDHRRGALQARRRAGHGNLRRHRARERRGRRGRRRCSRSGAVRRGHRGSRPR